jgi:hypothetical protein
VTEPTNPAREIADLELRVAHAQTASLKAFWGRRLVEAKRAHGGYPELQDLTVETVDALARYEAMALIHNLNGERFDE